MDAIKTTEDAIASLQARRGILLRELEELAEQQTSLQADLEAARMNAVATRTADGGWYVAIKEGTVSFKIYEDFDIYEK